ncbi:MAG: hypothetical protein V1766_09540 [Pseudomonadota bacterium]
MNEQKRAEEPGSNNYIKKVYFPIPQFSISKHIDFLSVNNIYPEYKNEIFDFLKDNGFQIVSDLKLENGNYVNKRTYRTETNVYFIDIFYDIKKLEGFPSLLIKIHDPDKQILSLFDSFFRDHEIVPKVSQVELTFDLFTNDIVRLYEFLQSHLFLKYSRAYLPIEYATTFYLGDLRLTKSKGMRVYLRPTEGSKEYVRIELLLKRELIRRLRLENTLSSVDSIDLQHFFDFRRLDDKAILDCITKKSKCHIERLEKRRKGSGGLLKRLIRDIFNDFFSGQETLMEKVNALKLQKNLVPQHNQFLKPLDDFNDKFFQMVSAQNFL